MDVLRYSFHSFVEAQWPNGQCVRSPSERSGFEPCLETLRCVLGQDTTLTVPLSTQKYRWVPENCWGNLTNCAEVTCDGLASRPEGIELLLAASCYGNRDKLRQHEPVLASRLYFFFCFFHSFYVRFVCISFKSMICSQNINI